MLATEVDSAVTNELIPDPLSPGPGAPGKYYLRQSSTYERTFLEVQVSREVPGHHWSKKYELGFIGVSK